VIQINSQDHQSILELITNYSFAWDTADTDGFADLFTVDSVFKFYLNGEAEPSTVLEGREAMRQAAISRAGYFKRIGLITKHFMPNTVLESVDPTTVKAKTQALITWQILDHGGIPTPVQAGYYLSVIMNTSDGWKFQQREAFLNGVFQVKQIFGDPVDT